MKIAIFFIAIAIVIGLAISILVYSWQHDEMTRMQLFKMFWKRELMIGVAYVVAVIANKKNQE
jgi:hypothetical protein